MAVRERCQIKNQSRVVRYRISRIRLLAAEIEGRLARSLDLTRSIETKSGFVAAAAGLVATGTVPTLADSSLWIVGVIPMALAAVTVAFATRALWPRTVSVPGARLLIDTYVESELTPEELEDHLLEVRTVEVENRDELNEARMKSMKVGFKFLVACLAAFIIVAVLNSSTLEGKITDGETPAPGPAETLAP